MDGKIIRNFEHGWNPTIATFLMLLAVSSISGFAANRDAGTDKRTPSAMLAENQTMQHEHLKTKLKAGTPAVKTPQPEAGSFGSGVPIARVASLPYKTTVLRTAQANDPSQFDHTFDLEANQFAVQVPAEARALMIKLQGRTRGGDVDLAIRFGQPVQIADSKLICNYRDDSYSNDLIAYTITPNLETPPLQPGLWYIAVGNGAPLATDYALSVDWVAAGARVDEMLLQVDDGSYDQQIGFAKGTPRAYFLNRLTPPSYPATLKSIHIYFGNQSGGLAVRERFRLLAGVNPTGGEKIDGIPFETTESEVGFLDGFNRYDLPKPLVLDSGDFIVGYEVSSARDLYPAYQDTSSSSRLRSYVSSDGMNFTILDRLGVDLVGNIGIRASISLPGAVPGNLKDTAFPTIFGVPFDAYMKRKDEDNNDNRDRAAGAKQKTEGKPSPPRPRAVNNPMTTGAIAGPLSATQARPPASQTALSDGTAFPSPGARAYSGKAGQGAGWILNSADEPAAGKRVQYIAKAGPRAKAGNMKSNAPKGVTQKTPGSKKGHLQSGLWLAAIGGVLARLASFILGKR